MMSKILVVALVACVAASPQEKAEGAANSGANTRGFLGGLLGGNRPGGFGHGGFGQGGFGGNRPGGFGQGGFGHGGFNQGGFGGGFAHNGGFGGKPGARPAQCRNWCKTPEGQAYCCETNNQPITPDSHRGGQCPPVRDVCPVRGFGGPPQGCSKHGDCVHGNRCCYDRCLQEHVCKQALGVYGR